MLTTVTNKRENVPSVDSKRYVTTRCHTAVRPPCEPRGGEGPEVGAALLTGRRPSRLLRGGAEAPRHALHSAVTEGRRGRTPACVPKAELVPAWLSGGSVEALDSVQIHARTGQRELSSRDSTHDLKLSYFWDFPFSNLGHS